MELLKTRPCVFVSPRRQQGVVLFIALIVLALLSVAAVAVVRSMDTSNVISGNFAFKQAAMQASDRAITDAMNNLANIALAGGGNTDVANRYFSLRQVSVDSRGIPTAINWDNVPCVDEMGAAVPNCDTDTGKYRIQYYIERQCQAVPNLSDAMDIKTQCSFEVKQVSPEVIAIHYRIIIRARGPRNATGFYEVMVGGPATT